MEHKRSTKEISLHNFNRTHFTKPTVPLYAITVSVTGTLHVCAGFSFFSHFRQWCDYCNRFVWGGIRKQAYDFPFLLNLQAAPPL